MAQLRLKMQVHNVRVEKDGDGKVYQENISLFAVYGKDGTANAQWSKWTPSAQLNLSINNPGAFGKLKSGDYVFVDLAVTTEDAI